MLHQVAQPRQRTINAVVRLLDGFRLQHFFVVVLSPTLGTARLHPSRSSALVRADEMNMRTHPVNAVLQPQRILHFDVLV